MKIVIAPDKFKGSLSAAAVAGAIARGILRVDSTVEIDRIPLADGGEGTVAALVAARGGRLITRRVTGPLPEMKVDATFGLLDDGRTAVIECSAASGLALLRPEDRDPRNTTTFGTGELMVAAIREGAKHLILGLGGSATIDAGIGCAQACGFTVLLKDGEPTSMTEPLCGRDLHNVLMVKHGRGEVTNGIRITIAGDVQNPLYGPNGAAPVYGPQKGATPTVVEEFDRLLREFAERTGMIDIAQTPGAGAAGGLGYGLLAFFHAQYRDGFETVAEAANLRARLGGADLCITGEGSLDAQTLHGKTVAGVARVCKQLIIPCVAIAGSIGEGIDRLREEGLTACFSLCDGPMTFEEAVHRAPGLLENIAANAFSLFVVGLKRT